MRASPNFKFWTPGEAMQFIRHGIRFAGGGYKSRMVKARRSPAYLYFVDAEAKTIAREGAWMGRSRRSHQRNEQGRSIPV